MNALDGAVLAEKSAAATSGRVAVEVVQETGSTNTDLLARAAVLNRPTLLAAETQTAGRGRAGRSWLSAAGGSLTFSLAWKFDGGPARLAGLPLAVGAALAGALADLGMNVQLKWPNDVLKNGDKLAGILIETQAAPGATWAVIGIGLNLELPNDVEDAIGRPVSCATWLTRMDRNLLLALVLDSLVAMLEEFALNGFGPYCSRWNRLHAWQGMPVTILDRGAVQHEGIAAGVDETGQLLLDTAAGRIAVLSGDVSLRLKE